MPRQEAPKNEAQSQTGFAPPGAATPEVDLPRFTWDAPQFSKGRVRSRGVLHRHNTAMGKTGGILARHNAKTGVVALVMGLPRYGGQKHPQRVIFVAQGKPKENFQKKNRVSSRQTSQAATSIETVVHW